MAVVRERARREWQEAKEQNNLLLKQHKCPGHSFPVGTSRLCQPLSLEGHTRSPRRPPGSRTCSNPSEPSSHAWLSMFLKRKKKNNTVGYTVAAYLSKASTMDSESCKQLSPPQAWRSERVWLSGWVMAGALPAVAAVLLFQAGLTKQQNGENRSRTRFGQHRNKWWKLGFLPLFMSGAFAEDSVCWEPG